MKLYEGTAKSVLLFLLVLCCLFVNSYAITECVDPADYSGKIRVACIGDSITYGAKIINREQCCYPSQLQKLLGDRFEVENFGLSGARVTHKTRLPYKTTDQYKAALAFKPNVVFICLGINDTSVSEWNRNKQQFIANYSDLIDSFQNLPTQPPVKIWIGTLMPVVPPYEPYLDIQKNIKEAGLLIQQIANETGLSLIDLFTRLNMEPQFFPDGLHPNAAGAGIIAELAYKAITGDHGGLKMSWIFGDHMVLQRKKPIPVFGTANVGQKVTVSLADHTATTVADVNGRWRVNLPPVKAGGPFTVSVKADRSLVFEDVLIGEVWFASGQSNMDWSMSRDSDWKTEGPAADKYPDIRLFNRQGYPSGGAGKWTKEQMENVTVDTYYSGKWEVGSKSAAAPFSAVAYYFAREIHHAIGVPVGIIDDSKGGAPMEAFMPRDALMTPQLYPLTKDWINSPLSPDWHRRRARQNLSEWFSGSKDTPMTHHPFEPTFLFDADMADLIPFFVRGVIWYQGETNATGSSNKTAWDKEHNSRLFESLITSWRYKWNRPDLPFYYVQLPNLNRNWMLFREMQLEMLNKLPGLGMAVTIDLGHPTNVHPPAKQEVARRLSLWARAKTYQENIVYSGPLFNGVFIDVRTNLRVGFDHVGKGLRSVDGGPINGFEIAGSDGVWHRAKAIIKSPDQLIISSQLVPNPQAVRYAWAPNPVMNLCNCEMLPASPFRAGDMNFENDDY